MLPKNIRAFVADTHRGVLTTFRRDGAAQMSIITDYEILKRLYEMLDELGKKRE